MYTSSPNPGSIIKVMYRTPDQLYHDLAERIDIEYIGTVLPVNKWDLPDTFNLSTGNSEFPMRVISLHRVVNIEYVSGEGREITANDFETKEFQVVGSKGDMYTVTRTGHKYTCTCVAFQWKKHCKHINEVSK